MIESSRLLNQVPGLVHAFSTREGGCSVGQYASLNLGFNTDDNPEHIEKNLDRLKAKLNVKQPIFEVQQVHGARVLPTSGHHTREEEADALWTNSTEMAIGVRTADCAPILIAHRAKESKGAANMICAVHAGWRGAVAGIVDQAISTLCSNGASREHLIFAIGPCIGPTAFEVGKEVIDAAQARLTKYEVPFQAMEQGKAYFDLREFVVRHLLELDIKRSAIDLVGGCTHSNPGLYFSHRRDHGLTGRHMSCIMMTG